jgi:NAD(P)-dependent dehydrogenase (short-subunit alcohol dehydrogenase family)
MSVEGKVVLITGAARGMGREMTRAFLREGAKVIATDLSWVPTGVSNDDYDFRAEIEGDANALAGVMDVTLQSHVDAVYD